MAMVIGTLQFNNKSAQNDAYNYLRNRCILAEKRTKGRGDHHLRVHVPIDRTWPGIVQALAAQGFIFLNYGSEIE